MFSDLHKCIFIHIPKCGGDSINTALNLSASCDKVLKKNPQNGHGDIFYHEQLFYKNFFSFSFVRNPYDRVCSLYHYFKDPKCLKWNCNKRTYGAFCNIKSFKDFVFRIDDFNYDQHFKSQHRFIEHPRLSIDFLGRFENLKEDFATACNKAGIPPISLPHTNQTKHSHYRDYYDDESYKIVTKKYEEDIKRFNYKF